MLIEEQDHNFDSESETKYEKKKLKEFIYL